MPGQAIGPVLLVGFAISMFTGLWLRWRAQFDGATVNERARRPRPVSGTTSMLIGLAFVGVVFVALGVMTTPLAQWSVLACLIVAVGDRRGRLRRRSRPVTTRRRPERAGHVAVARRRPHRGRDPSRHRPLVDGDPADPGADRDRWRDRHPARDEEPRRGLNFAGGSGPVKLPTSNLWVRRGRRRPRAARASEHRSP